MTDCKITNCVCACAKKILCWIDFISPLVPLAIRLYMGWVFFNAGLAKISNWGGTLYLFAEEYKVPVLPPVLAAYMGTGVELIAPVLLALGFGARLGAAMLLVQTGVIALVYPMQMEQEYWALLIAIIFFQGPGKLSVDYLLRKRCEGACEKGADEKK